MCHCPRHIGAADPPIAAGAGVSARKHIDWDAQPLGRELDTVTAARVGCSPVAVAYARRARGIPAFKPCGRIDRTAIVPLLGRGKTDRAVAALVGALLAAPNPHGATIVMLLEDLEREGFGACPATSGPHLAVGPERVIPDGTEGGPVEWIRRLLNPPVPLSEREIEHGRAVAARLG